MKSDRYPAWGLLPLRLVAGGIFIAHGWLKIHTIGIAGTERFMAGLGIPMASVAAVAIPWLEVIGGGALIAGVATRWIAALLAMDMLGAIFFAKRTEGFFAPKGWEFELTLFTICVTLALIGAGGVSIDATFANRRFPSGRD